MKTARREQRIIGLLESRGEISVNELSEILDISVSTLRKQLSSMDSKTAIKVVRGAGYRLEKTDV